MLLTYSQNLCFKELIIAVFYFNKTNSGKFLCVLGTCV